MNATLSFVLWCLMAILFCPDAAKAMAVGSESPRIINFDRATYGGQNQIWMIGQSPLGWMYFGNNAGLLEYDGMQWHINTLPDRQIVRAVASDLQGRIFVGGFGEFGYWSPEAQSGKMVYHSLAQKVSSKLLPHEEIWHITVLEHGVLFQSFAVIYYYDYHKVVEVSPPGNIMFLYKVGADIIVPVIGKGLYRWSPDGGFSFIAGSARFAYSRIKTVLPHGKGWIIGAEQEGLWQYDGQVFVEWKNEAQTALKTYQLNKAIALSNGAFAVGTILNGLYLLNEQGELMHHISKKSGLQNNTVLALYQDMAGDLWIGLDKGIDLLALSDPLSYYQDRSGKIGAVYAATLYEGKLYVGTNQGVYYKSWPTAANADFQLLEGTQGQVWALIVKNGLLLCGHNDGTLIIHKNKVVKISDVTGGWQLTEWGSPHRLLQATYTGLIAMQYNSKTSFWQMTHRIEGYGEPIKYLAIDKQGGILAANPYKGLKYFVLDSSSKKIISSKSLGSDEGLPSPFNIRLDEINGDCIVQADTFLLRWDPVAGRLLPLDYFKGVPLERGRYRLVNGIGVEWFKVFSDVVEWYSADKLIGYLPVRLTPDFEKVIAIDPFTYIFCLDNGYALLNRNEASYPNKTLPKPLIKAVAIAGGQVFYPELLKNKRLPGLPSAANRLRFEFSAPFYTRPLRFRSRLNGIEDSWSEWTTSPFREFTNLSSGNYAFELQSSLSNQTISLALLIKPRWYETNLAVGMLVALISASITLLWIWNQRRFELHRRHMEMDKEKQVQQERIRVRNEQLQADVLNKSKELATTTFSLVRKNETLLQIKEALNAIKADLGVRLPEKYYRQLIQLIDTHLDSDHDWQVFETNFNQVHEVFFKKLIEDFPDMTPGDLRLAAYLKMNLSSKEIAPLLNISLRGVENKRYRLRLKLGLPMEANLTEFLMRY